MDVKDVPVFLKTAEKAGKRINFYSNSKIVEVIFFSITKYVFPVKMKISEKGNGAGLYKEMGRLLKSFCRLSGMC